MQINRVTITGADDKTDIQDLIDLTKQFPFVEWGILFSGSKQGQSRYPSHSTIGNIAASALPLSAHFCGSYSRDVLENGKIGMLLETYKYFDRVQLNYNFSINTKWSTDFLALKYWAENPSKGIILQSNKANSELIRDLAELPRWVGASFKNLHFLHDSSGGRGREIVNIPLCYPKNYTGYSGGIGPHNVTEICKMIYQYNSTKNVWIDMESGVRTNDQLDISKVFEVLSVCKEFISKNNML